MLLERRPDLQHLPLTCENTNTPLPYIDLVNETLEYFITNNLSLANYAGHDTDDSASDAELRGESRSMSSTPPTISCAQRPFRRRSRSTRLETLRRTLATAEVDLAAAMEQLRIDDAIERRQRGELRLARHPDGTSRSCRVPNTPADRSHVDVAKALRLPGSRLGRRCTCRAFQRQSLRPSHRCDLRAGRHAPANPLRQSERRRLSRSSNDSASHSRHQGTQGRNDLGRRLHRPAPAAASILPNTAATSSPGSKTTPISIESWA